MKNKEIKWLVIVASCLIVLMTNSVMVDATSPASNVNKVRENYSNSPSFTVEPIMPKNQKEEVKNYFSLMVNNGQHQVLDVKLTNLSDEPITLIQNISPATTNDNGVIIYGPNEREVDKTLKNSFADFAQGENEIKVKPKSETIAKVELTIPKDGFEGQILGGLNYSLLDSPESKPENTTTIINKFAYSVAVILENDTIVPANNIVLNSVKPTQRSDSNYIDINIQNTEAVIIRNMTINSEIVDHKGTSLYKSSNTHFSMAPNSNFNYGINLKNKLLNSGEYTLLMDIEAEGELFHYEKSFDITKKQSKKMKEASMFIEETSINYGKYLLITIILGVFIYTIMTIKKYVMKLGGEFNER